MAVAPNGDLLVSVPGEGRVVLVRSNGGDPFITSWATGLYRPHDIVFHNIGGTVYVYVSEGERSRGTATPMAISSARTARL